MTDWLGMENPFKMKIISHLTSSDSHLLSFSIITVMMPPVLGIWNLELPGLRPVTFIFLCACSFLGDLTLSWTVMLSSCLWAQHHAWTPMYTSTSKSKFAILSHPKLLFPQFSPRQIPKPVVPKSTMMSFHLDYYKSFLRDHSVSTLAPPELFSAQQPGNLSKTLTIHGLPLF